MTKDDAVPVTAEARKAAADLLNEVSSLLGDDGIGQVADLIRDGEYDEHDATLAFARFERDILARHRGSTAGVDVEAAAAWLFDNRWSVPHPMGCRWQEAQRSTQEAWTAYAKGAAAALTTSAVSAALSQTPATPMDDQMVTFVVCTTCGGEFDEGEWDADTRCPECEQPKRWNEKRTRLIGTNPLPAPTPGPIGKDAVQEGLREALEVVKATCRIGKPGTAPSKSKWVHMPAHTYYKVCAALSATPAPPVDETDRLRGQVIADIDGERRRQVEAEGWTNDHDDEHADCQMAGAAACYAISAIPHWAKHEAIRLLWPWAKGWWKPRSHRENLVRAGALIVAEIERIDRAAIADRTQEGEVRRG